MSHLIPSSLTITKWWARHSSRRPVHSARNSRPVKRAQQGWAPIPARYDAVDDTSSMHCQEVMLKFFMCHFKICFPQFSIVNHTSQFVQTTRCRSKSQTYILRTVESSQLNHTTWASKTQQFWTLLVLKNWQKSIFLKLCLLVIYNEKLWRNKFYLWHG